MGSVSIYQQRLLPLWNYLTPPLDFDSTCRLISVAICSLG
jgi:hypothetical protein